MSPYVKMRSAAQLILPGSTARVGSPEELILWQRLVIDGHGGLVRPWECHTPAVAFINHGNWGVRCPHCHAGTFTHPVWKLAACVECGAVIRHVVVSEHYRAIERVLLQRPQRWSHTWEPHESIEELIAQNAVLLAEVA